jgi:CubicO group peptidase (beta-lactamase class C family)
MGKNGNRILSSYGVNLMRANHLDENQLKTFSKKVLQFQGYGYGFGVRSNINPAAGGNLMPVGEFGWDGAKLSFLSACPETGIAIFHAEHMGALHTTVIPRLSNVLYSCLDD